MRLRYLGFLAIVSLMAVVLAACGGGAAPTATARPAATTAPKATTAPATGAADYTIAMLGNASGSYHFDIKDLSLTAGKSYTVKVTSDAELHTWSIKDPNTPGKYLADSGFVAPNQSATVQFTAPAAGTYDLVCIPHEALGMKGTITVK